MTNKLKIHKKSEIRRTQIRKIQSNLKKARVGRQAD